MRVLLITAPISQLNAPYPATAYLTGFLRRNGIDAVQADASLELALRLFSKQGLLRIHGELEKSASKGKKRKPAESVQFFLDNLQRYLAVIDPTIQFLQGRDSSLAYRICSRSFLPEGPTFKRLHDLENDDPDALGWAFGSLGLIDRAKYLAGLFIEDLTMIVGAGIDSRFALGRYGEELAASESDFSGLHKALQEKPNLLGKMIQEIVQELIQKHTPDVVGVSAPFSGNVYGAFQLAQAFKKANPRIKTVFGGGFVNTNLRDLKEPRVFDYFDFVALDAGEPPFLSIVEFLRGKFTNDALIRTYVCASDSTVILKNGKTTALTAEQTDPKKYGPVYDGLPLDSYLATCEMLNPMGRLWSDTRWNKLFVAHGCYWRKCSFCDISLDYIERYDPLTPMHLVDQIEGVMKETGKSGFHFVDEAAPPTMLARMANELKQRDLSITWWGNVRFDKAFSPKLVELLAQSGCIAVTGGLETASDRLLKLMNKGVTVEQVAKVTRNFAEAGIMVHAYLIYGFPTQTVQETVDALENVRQLFLNGCLQSAYYHRFTLTAHSGVAMRPKDFGVKIIEPPGKGFSRNVLAYEERGATKHDLFGPGLEKAVYNYMHGVGLEDDVREWFDFSLPKTKVAPDFIEKILN